MHKLLKNRLGHGRAANIARADKQYPDRLAGIHDYAPRFMSSLLYGMIADIWFCCVELSETNSYRLLYFC
jgi:hypothetical protein